LRTSPRTQLGIGAARYKVVDRVFGARMSESDPSRRIWWPVTVFYEPTHDTLQPNDGWLVGFSFQSDLLPQG
jgi:hypothetical protein